MPKAIRGFIITITLCYVACVILEGNKVEDLKYKTLFYPVTSIAAIILSAVVVAMLFDQTEKIVIYFGIPSVLLLFIGYKIFSTKDKDKNVRMTK